MLQEAQWNVERQLGPALQAGTEACCCLMVLRESLARQQEGQLVQSPVATGLLKALGTAGMCGISTVVPRSPPGLGLQWGQDRGGEMVAEQRGEGSSVSGHLGAPRYSHRH